MLLSVSSLSFLAAPKRWRKVGKCARTKELTCSLMCLEKQDLFNKFKGRVRAVSPNAKSPWVESKYLEYLFEGRSVGKGLSGRFSVQELGSVALLCNRLSPTSPVGQRPGHGPGPSSLISWQGVRGVPQCHSSAGTSYYDLLWSTALIMNHTGIYYTRRKQVWMERGRTRRKGRWVDQWLAQKQGWLRREGWKEGEGEET